MARRFNNADPTANAAIKNVDRQRRTAATENTAKTRQGRRLIAEFPDIFAGLKPVEIRDLAVRACALAGNDVQAITREHLEQAKAAKR